MIYLFYTVFLGMFCWIENFAKISEKNKKTIVILVTFSWIVMSTVRTVAAGDYVSYNKVFLYALDTSSWSKSIETISYEPLYVTIMFFCKVISNNYAFFNFVTYFIVAVLQYKVLKRWCDDVVGGRNYLITSFFLIWCLQFGNVFVNRQVLSIWICLYSLKYIEDRKIFRFLICVVIASTFHFSSILFVLAYVVYWMDTSFDRNILLAVVFTLGCALFFSRGMQIANTILPFKIANRLSAYLNADVTVGFSNNNALSYAQVLLKGFVNIGIVLVICYFVVKSAEADAVIKRYVNIYLVSCVLYISSILYVATLARISTVFLYTQIPIMLYSLKIFKGRANRIIWWHCLILYLVLRFALIIYSDYLDYIPFTTIFNS